MQPPPLVWQVLPRPPAPPSVPSPALTRPAWLGRPAGRVRATCSASNWRPEDRRGAACVCCRCPLLRGRIRHLRVRAHVVITNLTQFPAFGDAGAHGEHGSQPPPLVWQVAACSATAAAPAALVPQHAYLPEHAKLRRIGLNQSGTSQRACRTTPAARPTAACALLQPRSRRRRVAAGAPAARVRSAARR